MTGHIFRQAVVISLLGHLTLFGMFGFSFGRRIPAADFSRVYFWGAVFRAPDLISGRPPDAGYHKGAFTGKTGIFALSKARQEDPFAYGSHSKPQFSFAFSEHKMEFTAEPEPVPPAARKRAAITFYPALPYRFALYFKDRQAAHIELEYQVKSADKRNFVLVRRKVSSGNLEADLLSMRYISRYLFMRQSGFTPDKWQVVKIDLSTFDD
ncbi:MAG: hypothetical protein WC301_06890 [Candidatus Omnitrophota bacterium]|jgi:hypothetical protein